MERPKITQAMINAYDEYTHLTLDRRDFMQKLQLLAGSAAAAAAIAPLIAADSAKAEIIPPNDSRLDAGDITYAGAPAEITAYMAAPKGGPQKLPSVIVIHENRGLNPYIEDVARRFATANFIAIAPDGLTSVGGYPGNDEEGGRLFGTVDRTKMGLDLLAAAKWVKANPSSNGKLGAVGFCFGGGIVNQLAVTMGADLNAGVPFYGADPYADPHSDDSEMWGGNGDPSDADIAAMAREARAMAQMMGEPLDAAFDEALRHVEGGADPDEVFGELDARESHRETPASDAEP